MDILTTTACRPAAFPDMGDPRGLLGTCGLSTVATGKTRRQTFYNHVKTRGGQSDVLEHIGRQLIELILGIGVRSLCAGAQARRGHAQTVGQEGRHGEIEARSKSQILFELGVKRRLGYRQDLGIHRRLDAGGGWPRVDERNFAHDFARLQTGHLHASRVDLELTVDLSATLNAQFDQGELDVVLAKRRTGEVRGQLVWRDRLAWICGPGLAVDPQAPLPLILYAPPSLTRSVALETLERAGRAWRVVCTSGSLSGLRAAALAGLGITLHARSLIPEGLVEAPATLRLPEAGEVEFVVSTRRGAARGPAAALAEAILANGDRLGATS